MRRLLSLTLLVFLLIIYIYSITFIVIPISTKILLEIVCLVYCLKYIISDRFRLKNQYKIILALLFVMIIWDLFTSLANGGHEFYLATRMITVIGSLFTAHCVYLFSLKITNRRDVFFKIMALVILFESAISLLMKFFPFIYDLLSSFLIFDLMDEYASYTVFEVGRFHGIGSAMFFGVLPSATIGLMTSMYLFAKSEDAIKKAFWLFTWVFILAISFLTARYSIIIGCISLVYFVFVSSKKNLLKNIIPSFFLLLFGYLAYIIILNNSNSSLLGWAFGAFTGDSRGGDTVEFLKDWWLNTKFELKTFLIGDARYMAENGVFGYYKNIDIGIFRQIFYGGIIGLLLNLYTHAKILKMASKFEPQQEYKYMLFFLMLCYIVILAKGDANMMSFFILYLVVSTKGIFQKCC